MSLICLSVYCEPKSLPFFVLRFLISASTLLFPCSFKSTSRINAPVLMFCSYMNWTSSGTMLFAVFLIAAGVNPWNLCSFIVILCLYRMWLTNVNCYFIATFHAAKMLYWKFWCAWLECCLIIYFCVANMVLTVLPAKMT